MTMTPHVATTLVLVVITYIYWRSVLRLLLAVLFAALLLGGMRLVQLVNQIAPDQLGLTQSGTHSMIAAGSRGVGTRPSITLTRNSTAKPRA